MYTYIFADSITWFVTRGRIRQNELRLTAFLSGILAVIVGTVDVLPASCQPLAHNGNTVNLSFKAGKKSNNL